MFGLVGVLGRPAEDGFHASALLRAFGAELKGVNIDAAAVEKRAEDPVAQEPEHVLRQVPGAFHLRLRVDVKGGEVDLASLLVVGRRRLGDVALLLVVGSCARKISFWFVPICRIGSQ